MAYTVEDLNWHDSLSRSSVEMREKSAHPAIQGKVENMKGYETTVYIGFPIWWEEAPRATNTFNESNDLVGKIVKAFDRPEKA